MAVVFGSRALNWLLKDAHGRQPDCCNADHWSSASLISQLVHVMFFVLGLLLVN